MRLTTRLHRLEKALPRCGPRVQWLVGPDEELGDADRCPRCGGSHVLVVEEVVVEPPDNDGSKRR